MWNICGFHSFNILALQNDNNMSGGLNFKKRKIKSSSTYFFSEIFKFLLINIQFTLKSRYILWKKFSFIK